MAVDARVLASLLGGAALLPSGEVALAQHERAQLQDPPCDALTVEYTLSANLQLTETPMGKGDGVYRIGPGVAVLRFEQRDGVPSGPAQLVSYGMVERFKIDARTAFWRTHVTTDSRTTVASDSCGVVANARLVGRRLEWTSDVRARTDGKLTCVGSLCGKFGAPPSGTSALHVPPHDVRFNKWTFAPDMRSFTMESTWMATSESPKQTAHVALTGREVRRGCATVPQCPSR